MLFQAVALCLVMQAGGGRGQVQLPPMQEAAFRSSPAFSNVVIAACALLAFWSYSSITSERRLRVAICWLSGSLVVSSMAFQFPRLAV